MSKPTRRSFLGIAGAAMATAGGVLAGLLPRAHSAEESPSPRKKAPPVCLECGGKLVPVADDVFGFVPEASR